MKKALLIGLACASCAEEVPGFAPPEGQLYFPLGIAIAEPSSETPILLVGNSNFDQRYNAGFVSCLDLKALHALAIAPLTGVAADAPPGDRLHVIDSFPNAYFSQTKVPQLGGPILHVPRAATGFNTDRVFVAARGSNRVTMLSLDLGGTPRLNCKSNNGVDIEATDCSEGWVFNADFDDPYALAYVPVPGTPGVVATSYVQYRVDSNQNLTSAISAIDLAVFEKRTTEDGGPNTTLSKPFRTSPFTQFGGTSGLTTVPGATANDPPRLLGAALRSGNSLPITSFSPADDPIAGVDARFVLNRVGGVDLGTAASVAEIRGVAVTPTRAYAAIRFLESNSAFNAGIAVLDITGANPVLLTLIELGDELGLPVIAPGGRFLYVPDVRDDAIYIVDIGADQPVYLSAIRGRMERTLDGERVQARILASPTDLVFHTIGGKTLLYVTNFANSTLAVVDASDPDPRRHELIARFGRAIDAAGKMEGEE